MNKTKLNVYKMVLHEVCDMFDGAEEFIKEKIEEICCQKKLSAEEVTFLNHFLSNVCRPILGNICGAILQ